MRTEQESDRRRREESGRLRDQQRACRMVQASAEKLEHTEPAEKRELPQCRRESIWQERQSCLYQKEKEQSHLSRAPDREMGESQSKREPHLGEREGDQSKSMEEKSGLRNEGKQVLRR